MLVTHVDPPLLCDCMHMPVCITKCRVSVLSRAGYRADCSSVEANIHNSNSTKQEQITLTTRLRRRIFIAIDNCAVAYTNPSAHSHTHITSSWHEHRWHNESVLCSGVGCTYSQFVLRSSIRNVHWPIFCRCYWMENSDVKRKVWRHEKIVFSLNKWGELNHLSVYRLNSCLT